MEELYPPPVAVVQYCDDLSALAQLEELVMT